MRSRARAEAEAGPPAKRRTGMQLKLRSGRRLVVGAKRRRTSSPANSSSAARKSPLRGGRISTGSSNAPCDAMELVGGEPAGLRSGSVKSGGEYSEAAVCNHSECSRESHTRRRETTPSSSSIRDQFGELESTAEKKVATRCETAAAMPAPSEIEEFFAAAESAEKRRFTDKYNFDVERDVPLDGRYEWVRSEA